MNIEPPPLQFEPIPPGELVEAAPSERIRVTNLYLVVCMVTSGLILQFGYDDLFTKVLGDVSQREKLIGIVILINGLIVGAALATWMYVVKRIARRSFPFPKFPGHWLCLVVSLSVVVGMASYQVLKYLMHESIIFESTRDYFIFLGAQQLFSLLIFLVPLFSGMRPSYWKIAFGLFAVAKLGIALFMGYRALILHFMNDRITIGERGDLFKNLPTIQFSAAGASAIVLIVFVLIDFFRRKSYDWVHWLGIGVFFVQFVTILAIQLIFRYMTSS